jgi:hypothetical protein
MKWYHVRARRTIIDYPDLRLLPQEISRDLYIVAISTSRRSVALDVYLTVCMSLYQS